MFLIFQNAIVFYSLKFDFIKISIWYLFICFIMSKAFMVCMDASRSLDSDRSPQVDPWFRGFKKVFSSLHKIQIETLMADGLF